MYIDDDSIQAWLLGKTKYLMHKLITSPKSNLTKIDRIADLVQKGKLKEAVYIADDVVKGSSKLSSWLSDANLRVQKESELKLL